LHRTKAKTLIPISIQFTPCHARERAESDHSAMGAVANAGVLDGSERVHDAGGLVTGSVMWWCHARIR
jgi:hypothetical protein